jgi:multisubunit Na+/H+ antiporter MnhC subunit
MLLFRGLLILIFIVLSVYTAMVISNHGWNLLAVFFGDMQAMTWPGQFNLDFMGFLSLSALWTAWRHSFSPLGFALAIVAFFGGMAFLTIYLLVASYQVKGDVRALLLGAQRARA